MGATFPSHKGFCMRLSLAVALSTFMAALIPGPATAQESLRVAAAADRTVPGFNTIDSSLLSIEHTSPTHATSLTVFSTLRKDDLLPRDVAVELLPWLTTPGARAATLEEQYASLFKPGIGSAIRQYFAGSLAISQDVTGSDATGTASLSYVSIGFRTFVLAGRSRARLEARMKEFIDASKELDAAVKKGAAPGATADDKEQARITDLFLRTRTLRREIAEAGKDRVGFLLEVGTAWVLEVPENTLQDARVGRRAGWVNPIYRFDELPVDAGGVIRYITEPITDSELLDFGGRIGAKRGGVLYSLEGLGRKRWVPSGSPLVDTLNARLVMGITYGVSRSTQLNFTFGKNFKYDYSRGGSLLASFGLSIGLGELPLSADE
jgi:hypothetical protein